MSNNDQAKKKILIDEIYSDLSLFQDIDGIDIKEALKCLVASEKVYEKEEHIVDLGERIRDLVVILSGNVYLYNVDSQGERNILFEMKRGDLIGGPSVFSEDDAAPYGAVCVDRCRVLEIDPSEIISKGEPLCRFKSMIMRNLLFMISEENRSLRNKLYMTSIRSLREKIYNYLYLQASINKSNAFTIPFVNRSDLADYLNVNCSALSRELGRMKDEDILDFYKNSFILKRYP
ncbi:MAG: Crp/Fnr family transcriptional regulator [Peptostreptococcaceae bacterium]|nr:Crp/Fnr family transcriptional regulator [Peptostreptococcaceae bacterium]